MRLTLALIAVNAASPAAAAMSTASAQLAAPPRVAAVVTGAGLWRCDGPACTGQLRSPRQAVAVCAEVADEAGRVATFTVDGTALADDDLARCNRHAKP